VAQGSSFRPIRRHEPILLDYVFAYNGYLSDHARIFALGRLPQDLETAHTAMLQLQNTVKTTALPGTRSGDLYTLALDLATASGYGDHFMGVGEQRIRFVGHGIGLELDEFPFLAQGQTLPLEEGMVIALEPKLIFPERGVVGIENTHVVTKNGLEQLTQFPDEIFMI
jgi:Xaa-Pro aminopeptidase